MSPFASILLFLFASLAAGAPLTLREAMTRAEQHPAVLAASLKELQLSNRADLLGALPDPMLSISVQPVPVETRVGPQWGALGIQQQLPWPGLRASRREAMRSRSVAQGFSSENLARRQRLEAARSWLTLWKLDREIEAWEQHLVWLDKVLASVQAGHAAGLGQSQDRVEAGLEKELARLRLDRLRAGRPALLIALATVMGVEQAQAWQLPALLALPPVPEPVTTFPGHPWTNQQQSMVRAAEAEHRTARLEARPRISIGLQWVVIDEARMQVSDSGKDPLMLTMGLSLPIRSAANRARRLEAEAGLHAARAATQDIQLLLETQQGSALAAYEQARLQAERTQEVLLPQALSLLELRETEYETGRARFDELVMSARRPIDLEVSAKLAVADAWQAALELEELTRTSAQAKERP